MGVDLENFANLGLGFSLEDSRLLKSIYKKLVPLCMGAGALVGANAIYGADKTAGKGMGSGQLTLINLLVAMGVGAAVGGAGCYMIKLKVETYISQYSSTEDAIAGLTPGVRAGLAEEARKILAMKSRIDSLMRRDNANYDLMA